MSLESKPQQLGRDGERLRVLIVSEHASTKFGGEAILPWHYFKLLSERGIDVWMIVHSRTRDELLSQLPDEIDPSRLAFIEDTLVNIWMWRLGRFLPQQIAYFTFGAISRLQTQRSARRLAQLIIERHGINVVHQPIPVSPREPSVLYNLGVPVVIGPMNGNMSYPPAFVRGHMLLMISFFTRLGRHFSGIANCLFPGKLNAEILLVANSRTREAIPANISGQVLELAENGVDLDVWSVAKGKFSEDEPVRFIYIGRLIHLKRVDLLLNAFAAVQSVVPALLTIVGDGPLRNQLETQSKQLNVASEVEFVGWKSQTECAQLLRQSNVLVLPSIHECGGAVVLEAMASGLPVIATDWGGPADYINDTCGILVSPSSEESLTLGFTEAMKLLAKSPQRRAELGKAARTRVEGEFDWQAKIDRIIAIYRDAITRYCQKTLTNTSISNSAE